MMRPRAWLATWAEIGSLVADHIGEGLTMLARVIDPPPEREVDETVTVWMFTEVRWCDECSRSHQFVRAYAAREGEEPAYKGERARHEEDQ